MWAAGLAVHHASARPHLPLCLCESRLVSPFLSSPLLAFLRLHASGTRTHNTTAQRADAAAMDAVEDADADVVYSGYLVKAPPIRCATSLTTKKWRQRFFVLKKAAKSLEYWEDERKL